MKPFFSVIIPTFNRADLLASAITSVLAQSFDDWELIVVDDGSTDHTSAIVHSFADDRITYIWQENGQLNAARNRGVSAATGLYICFCDDDDSYLPNHLSVHHSALTVARFPVAIAHSQMMLMQNGIVSDGNKYTPEQFGSPAKFAWEGGSVFALSIHHQIFHELKFDEKYILWEDAHFLVRVCLKFPFIQIDTTPTVMCNLHAQSRTTMYSENNEAIESGISAVADVFYSYRKELLAAGVTEASFQFAKSKLYLNHACTVVSRHKSEGLRLLARSIRNGLHWSLVVGYIRFLYKFFDFVSLRAIFTEKVQGGYRS